MTPEILNTQIGYALALSRFHRVPTVQNFKVGDCRGDLIRGSAAMYPVVVGRSFHVPVPNDLNIIVPPNEAEDVMNDFADFNYRCWRSNTILRPRRSVYKGYFWMGNFQGQPHNPCITVVEVSFTTLKGALVSVWTHQTNTITVQRAFSFYPRWALENVSLQGGLYPEVESLEPSHGPLPVMVP
ncbi:hypothetical protein BKA70DRAFT_1304400 [Coprinopsis sp. MPI-PUGE-AT-0042]|nr:hypothetical protein BKA70DRAFT_1304400 [Coprinopsis sp. MPI-PUGE-AT-0042]